MNLRKMGEQPLIRAAEALGIGIIQQHLAGSTVATRTMQSALKYSPKTWPKARSLCTTLS